MKIDFSQLILDLDGKPMDDDNGKPMTLGRACARALTSNIPIKGEEPPPGDKKVEMYDLALRILKGGEQEVKAEEIVAMKKWVNAGFIPLVVAQVWKMLDI